MQNEVLDEDAQGGVDNTIEVVGQQWSWTFNYIEDEALDGQTSVYQVGTPAEGGADDEPEHLAVIVKRPKSYSKEDDFLFKVLSNGLFLFKDKLIVVMGEEAPVLGNHWLLAGFVNSIQSALGGYALGLVLGGHGDTMVPLVSCCDPTIE